MNSEQFKGRKAIVKSTGQEGIISDVTTRFNSDKILTARFIIEDSNGRPIEYMPHEVEILTSIVSEQ